MREVAPHSLVRWHHVRRLAGRPAGRRAWRAFWLLACALAVGCESGSVSVSPPPTPPIGQGYFDAHNHGYSGVLPYYAYADIDAFIEAPDDPRRVVPVQRRKLWRYLVTDLPKKDSRIWEGPRISTGARETIKVYDDVDNLTDEEIDGALERVLTATPWTEFDSAYAIRGVVVDDYVAPKGDRKDRALCRATILQLAVTRTRVSHQFLSFVGGWGNETSRRDKLDIIRCFADEPDLLSKSGRLTKWLGPNIIPEIKVLLMTHTSELGQCAECAPPQSGGLPWRESSRTGSGQCQRAETGLRSTPPDQIERALVGEFPKGDLVPMNRVAFFRTVIGVDTAGPETTCFTGPPSEPSGVGMQNYKKIVDAVYAAAKWRRMHPMVDENGANSEWHGKLLVHTHVGEGGVVYQWGDVCASPARAVDQPTNPFCTCASSRQSDQPRSTFATFPAVPYDETTRHFVHVVQARRNVKTLLDAVDRIKQATPDIDDYVVFRFGHVTHADAHDAREMKRLRIEADINLESNIATRAYLTQELACPNGALDTASKQFLYNNLPGSVLASGQATRILSGHSLRYMLEAGVRTLLGSDGGGTEHSDIGRSYYFAAQLIEHWKAEGIVFPPGTDADIFHRNAAAHVAEMQRDRRLD